ncbi:MAG: DUF4446 family protein [Actinomycetota bacterium]|nr:DUF4446 family protein [Actinomycetota bacterium]
MEFVGSLIVDSVLSSLALLVALVALGIGVLALRRTAGTRRARRHIADAGADLPDDVLGLRHEVAALRLEQADALRHLAVVRYDAFGDMGGHLSWSLALLDDGGDGVVLTSIHGRTDARTYAKNISGWSCEQPLSPEEDDAVAHAHGQ